MKEEGRMEWWRNEGRRKEGVVEEKMRIKVCRMFG